MGWSKNVGEDWGVMQGLISLKIEAFKIFGKQLFVTFFTRNLIL